jgi:ElaB/YqjD/DUF883 family membrane-anchored ribosome-binding protein
MENEEVIRRRMEEKREALTAKLETLEQKVVDSVSAVTQTVASVQEKVHEGVESVKGAVDVKAHVDRHPWLMLGGAVLGGFVLGDLLLATRRKAPEPRFTLTPTPAPDRVQENGRQQNGQQAAEPNGGSNWLHGFEPEIQHLKGLALGAALGTVREMLTAEVPPHMAAQLRDIIDAVTKKAGGDPLPSSDWDAIKAAQQPHAGPACATK